MVKKYRNTMIVFTKVKNNQTNPTHINEQLSIKNESFQTDTHTHSSTAVIYMTLEASVGRKATPKTLRITQAEFSLRSAMKLTVLF